MSDDELVRSKWGDGYYKELEKFMVQHQHASRIITDTDLNCPVKAEYDFMPHTVVMDDIRLRRAIRKSNEENNE